MFHAYNDLYLNDAEKCLANAFDYAINTCGLQPDFFIKLFIISDYAELFERGDAHVLSGESGVELALAILKQAYPDKTFPEPTFHVERSPEYWAGWALAQYQFHTSKRFKDIFNGVSLSSVISMYPVFHELDISHFCEALDEKMSSGTHETKLKRIRTSRGLSQSELAYSSQVSLRSIQLYEQRVNDIDKAQAHTIYKLAWVLGCKMEDLLENPEK